MAYAIALGYDIPELKELAKRKFQALEKEKWTNTEFEAVRDAVFGTTPSRARAFGRCFLRLIFITSKISFKTLGFNHAMRAKTNDMRLLGRALAERILTQDELMNVTSTTQWALDQNKQGKRALQDELMKAKRETQRARDQI
ncbi:MAG: hypothetical protein Q9161_002535 [Pseudevernia consocians]